MEEEHDDEESESGADLEKSEKRRLRIERERADLLKSLAADDFSTLKNRVATVLNLVPSARDSDIVLCLKYWAMFQPDLYNPQAIAPSDLFKLERLHYIVRARAMIQNDYGLFVASNAIKNHRKRNEQSVKAEILADQPERSVMKVYADETGKNGKFVMVPAVWVLSGAGRFKLTAAIEAWRNQGSFGKREMHFASLGKTDGHHLSGFLDAVLKNSEYISFKVIGIERARTRRSITEVVAKLHEHMLSKGIEHEVESGRVSLPRSVEVTLDEEDTLDAIALAEIRSAVEATLSRKYKSEDLSLAPIEKASSKHSNMLQLADLVAGAVNRLRNHDGEPNIKDEFARQIVDRMGLSIEVGDNESFDSSTMLSL